MPMYQTKKSPIISGICICLLSLTSCSDRDKETDIPLSAVPANIIRIVQNTLPGIVLNEAEKEVDDKRTIYELEGNMINGLKYEIEILEDGTIIKIELED